MVADGAPVPVLRTDRTISKSMKGVGAEKMGSKGERITVGRAVAFIAISIIHFTLSQYVIS